MARREKLKVGKTYQEDHSSFEYELNDLSVNYEQEKESISSPYTPTLKLETEKSLGKLSFGSAVGPNSVKIFNPDFEDKTNNKILVNGMTNRSVNFKGSLSV